MLRRQVFRYRGNPLGGRVALFVLAWSRPGGARAALLIASGGLAMVLSIGLAPAGAGAAEAAGASGPLLAGQELSGAFASSEERDAYFYYVASSDPIPATLTLENRGEGEEAGRIDLTVLDAIATPVGATIYSLRPGESTSLSVLLAAGKYFVEVSAKEGPGGAYRLSAGGGDGAFVPYAAIASRCAAAGAATERAETRLRRAEARMQRATARLRRSRFGGVQQSRARTEFRRSRARLAASRVSLRSERRARQPWCSIPE